MIFKNLDLCKVDSSIVLISDGFVFHRYGSSMSMGFVYLSVWYRSADRGWAGLGAECGDHGGSYIAARGPVTRLVHSPISCPAHRHGLAPSLRSPVTAANIDTSPLSTAVDIQHENAFCYRIAPAAAHRQSRGKYKLKSCNTKPIKHQIDIV